MSQYFLNSSSSKFSIASFGSFKTREIALFKFGKSSIFTLQYPTFETPSSIKYLWPSYLNIIKSKINITIVICLKIII